jgi:hypothetical protein
MLDVKDKFSVSDTRYLNTLIDFMDELVIKSVYDASKTETVDSERRGEAYILAMEGRDTIFNYTLSAQVLKDLKIEYELLLLFEKGDKPEFYSKLSPYDANRIASYYRRKTIDEYVETNPYYLMLNGEPADDSEVVLIEDLYTGGKFPIHKFSLKFHPEMYKFLINYDGLELKNILKRLKEEEGIDYDYLGYLLRKTPYYKARRAENFQVLYSKNTLLESADIDNFYTSYNAAREYVLTVPYVKKWGREEELYDAFMSIVILLITFLRFFANKIEGSLKNDFTNNDDRILFLRQYGLEMLTEYLNDDQVVQLIQDIDDIISVKGSEEAIQRVLDLFKAQLKNVDIYRYILLKTVNCDPITKDPVIDPTVSKDNNYSITIGKIPVNIVSDAKSITTYLADKANHLTFESVAITDPFFGPVSIHGSSRDVRLKMIADMEKRLKEREQFTMMYTKYVGIVAHIDMTQSLVASANLFSSSICHSESTLETVGTINNGTLQLSVRHAIAAMNLIACHRHDMSDEIIYTPAHVSAIMGFNTEPDLRDLLELETSILSHNGDPDEVIDVPLKSILKAENTFVVAGADDGSQLEGKPDITNQTLRSFYYNTQIRDSLVQRMNETDDYDEYQALRRSWEYNMICKTNHTLFKGHKTFTEFLLAENELLYRHIMNTLNESSEYMWNDPVSKVGARKQVFLSACNDLTSECITVISKALGIPTEDSVLLQSNYTDNTIAFGRVMDVLNFFKHYTIQFATNDVVYDLNDKSHAVLKILQLMTTCKSDDKLLDTIMKHVYHVMTVSGDEYIKDESLSIKHTFSQSTYDEFESIIYIFDWMLDPKQRDFIKEILTVWSNCTIEGIENDIKDYSEIRHIIGRETVRGYGSKVRVNDWLDDHHKEKIRHLFTVFHKAKDRCSPGTQQTTLGIRHNITQISPSE